MSHFCRVSNETRGVFSERGLTYGESHAKSLANLRHGRGPDGRNLFELDSGASHAAGLAWRGHTGRQSQTSSAMRVRRVWVWRIRLLLPLRRLWLLSAQ